MLHDLTAHQLVALVVYETDTGFFRWRNGKMAVRIAGTPSGRMGYRRIHLFGKSYLAHRLAWLYVHGEWPILCIDHVNGVADDNRIANLRQATNGQNRANSRCNKNNQSGLKGVSRRGDKWQSSASLNGRHVH